MQFTYRAADALGNIEQGKEEADSREQLIGKLKAQGKFPLEVKAETNLVTQLTKSSMTNQERLNFTNQLAGLLEAGIPLERSLAIISRLKLKGELGELVVQLRRSLQEGMSFSAALERMPGRFSTLYINMVRAGEAGGILPQVLKRLGQYLEDDINLRRFITSSLFYPVIVLCGVCAALVFYLVVVVPKFQEIFQDMGRELPFMTRLVMGAGGVLSKYWLILAGAIGAGVFWYFKEQATPAGRLRIDQLKLKIPMVGQILQKVATSKLALSLSLLSSSGVSLLTSLEIVSRIVGNQVMGSALIQVGNEVQKGNTLAKSMSNYEVFPSLAVEMIGVGEESGNLGSMLDQVSKTYEAEVKHSLSMFMSAFEPMLILLLVGVMAIMMVAILLPIININSAMTNG